VALHSLRACRRPSQLALGDIAVDGLAFLHQLGKKNRGPSPTEEIRLDVSPKTRVPLGHRMPVFHRSEKTLPQVGFSRKRSDLTFFVHDGECRKFQGGFGTRVKQR